MIAGALLFALSAVGFDQRLGERLPLDETFRDETGAAVRLGDYFGPGPVVFSLVYFGCPMLCSAVLDGEARVLSDPAVDPGGRFTLVTISFDPADTPEQASRARDHYGARAGRDWHFLTGDARAIEAVARAAGFRYERDPATGQFRHAAGIVVTAPDGRLSRYFFGVDYKPADVRLALVEASGGKIGSPVDALLLACSRFDPDHGTYDVAVLRLVRYGALASLAAVLSLIAVLSLRRAHAGTP